MIQKLRNKLGDLYVKSFYRKAIKDGSFKDAHYKMAETMLLETSLEPETPMSNPFYKTGK